MKFTTTLAVLFLSASSGLAAPVDLVARDVWVPKVLAPHKGSVWHVGKSHQVKWAVNYKPKNISNPIGTIFLSHNGVLNTTHPLAKGFNLTTGHVSVTIPKGTPTGSNYTVVLLGNDKNASHKFTIPK